MDFHEIALKEMRRRKYSPRTIETYLYCINRFLNRTQKEVSKISKVDVKKYLYELSERNKSGNTINIHLNAIRFLLEDILNKNMKLNIKYSKTPKKLPTFLTREEIRKLLNAISNWKHRLMIEFLYGSGLRVGELINIRVKDININEGYVFVRNGKGKKDRIIVLAKVVIEKIKNLIEIEQLESEDFLFRTNREESYSVKSIQEIIKKAAKISGIKKEIHPHTLRHSFATHLIERGNTLSEVQGILGHKSPETSMIYVHMASPKLLSVKSPLDN